MADRESNAGAGVHLLMVGSWWRSKCAHHEWNKGKMIFKNESIRDKGEDLISLFNARRFDDLSLDEDASN